MTSNFVLVSTMTASVDPPSLLQMALYFSSSLVEHIGDGMRKCNIDDIKSRLAICQECEHFESNGHCGLCGCACGGQRAFLNKLAWASESCPAGKWESL